jgi:nicotinamidase-related amidase
MAFSCMGSDEVVNGLEKLGRTQVILCGIESHICVNQTAHDLLEEDYSVVLAHDAISARTLAMHEGAMARMKELGALSAHTESILYEWMETAEHPQFKAALSLVKSYPAP